MKHEEKTIITTTTTTLQQNQGHSNNSSRRMEYLHELKLQNLLVFKLLQEFLDVSSYALLLP